MKNIDKWVPTKYVFDGDGKLRASKDPKEVHVGSNLKANISAEYFGRYLPKFARGALLDLGCGKVPLYIVYRDLVESVTCVDWKENPHVDIARDLTKPLPFTDDSFDTIILSDVLEHIPKPEAIVSEMYRILRLGGHVLLTVPFYYWLHEAPYDYYRYTEHALRRFAMQTGFEIVDLQASGGALEIITDIVAKLLVMYGKRAGLRLGTWVQEAHLMALRTRFGQKVRKITRIGFKTVKRLISRLI